MKSNNQPYLRMIGAIVVLCLAALGSSLAHAETEGKVKGKIKTSGDNGMLSVGNGGIDTTPEGKVKGKITSPGDKGTLSAGGIGKTIDLNTASAQDFVIIMMLSPQVAQSIVAERSKGAFKSSADFAARVCNKHSIDSGFESSIKIQNEIHAPRGGEPKAVGFKCVAGQNTFEIAGKKHAYVGHVTLLR